MPLLVARAAAKTQTYPNLNWLHLDKSGPPPAILVDSGPLDMMQDSLLANYKL